MANWKTKVCVFFRCLLTPLANMFDHYLDAFYDAELRDCEPDKETGKNHCVYENYLDNEACVDKNNPNGNLPFYYPKDSDPSDYEDPNNTYIIRTASLGGLAIDGVKITVSKDGVTIVEGR